MSVGALKNIPDNETMLTTVDNPYNPKVDYDNWSQWDIEHGYDTEALVSRLMILPNDVDIDDEFGLRQAYDEVIQEILENDVLEIYMLV